MLKHTELKPTLIQPTKIVCEMSSLGGYGVFAADNILKDEIVEEAPFAILPYRTKDLVHDELKQLCYTLPCSCETCKHRGKTFIISSGYINLYNSSDGEDSSLVEFNYQTHKRLIIVTAKKDIKKGEEILHWYGPNYKYFDKPVK
jgi:hypothetical protein